MSKVCDLRVEYSNLCRNVESLLHNRMMVFWLITLFGDATGNELAFTLAIKCRGAFIKDLVEGVPLSLDKEELENSILVAVDTVYQERLEAARSFANVMVEGKTSHNGYVRMSHMEFVEIRRSLDEKMRQLFGDFFDKTMWSEECVGVPMLFKIDKDRLARSYQDEVNLKIRY